MNGAYIGRPGEIVKLVDTEEFVQLLAEFDAWRWRVRYMNGIEDVVETSRLRSIAVR